MLPPSKTLAAVLFSILAAIMAAVFFTQGHYNHPWVLKLQKTPLYVIQSEITTFLSAPLPPKNFNITVDNPLLFIHQRKTGGTSLRYTLASQAEIFNLSHFIACDDGVACDLYTMGPHRAAVYGGHFPYTDTKNLLRHVPLDPALQYKQTHNFSCITIFRDPVDRVESCYYYRFVQDEKRHFTNNNLKCMNDVPDAVLSSVLARAVDAYGDSCMNEPFRMFSSESADELSLQEMVDMRSDGYLKALKTTLERLSQCVVLVLEEPETFLLGSTWFPQMRGAFRTDVRLNSKQIEGCESLTAEKKELIRSLTEGERVVYDVARQRAQLLLDSINDKNNNTNNNSTGV